MANLAKYHEAHTLNKTEYGRCQGTKSMEYFMEEHQLGPSRTTDNMYWHELH